MPYPNFIIAGPPKSGTTSVFEWLSAHPETHPSKVKETYYFYDDAGMDNKFPNYNTDGLEPYQKLFKGWKKEKIIFEASPGYVYSNIARKVFKEISSEIKFLFIYREPAERLYSEFIFNRFKTKKFSGSFKEYIGYVNEEFTAQRIKDGFYYNHLSKWTSAFERKNILLLDFEDLKHNPYFFMKFLCEFLGIDHGFYKNFQFNRKNETSGLKSRSLHMKALKIQKFVPAKLRNWIIPLYYSFNKTGIPAQTDEEAELIAKLKVYYSKSVEQLMRDFSDRYYKCT